MNRDITPIVGRRVEPYGRANSLASFDLQEHGGTALATDCLEMRNQVHSFFHRFSHGAANAMGSPWAFLAALVLVVMWSVFGPPLHYSEYWQMVINTATTIVTFLMVFVIQNTQNRDSKAIHLKLDELIRAVKGARTKLVSLEDLTDEELAQLQKEFERVRRRAEAKDREAPQPGETARSETE